MTDERAAARPRAVAPALGGQGPDMRRTPSSGSLGDARFIPGTMLTGRYRIVELVGKGGMGEVYRAEDLKLNQNVALKFLPEGLENDEARLARLLGEVRTARQISHPNVCRVYDVGECDGQHFLTMEYVDGEDLGTLLRRIGRLPKDKAIQMARQMCAGLGAAHEQGILHRDLKPANVMIDGRGRVRITDFGLAGLAESFQGREVGAGTPAYMAPEQLAGREVSVRSDLYSLGLVLYEMFTGRPVFAARTHPDLARQQIETTPTNPSALVEGFDPAVERAILRCLEKDPRERPASAMAVAAALPGGDPLAAALAAGETPSPEMVAEAGQIGVLRPAVAWACLIGTLAGIALAVLGAGGSMMVRRVPFDRPPEALAEKARDLLGRLGYPDPPTDSAIGIEQDADYVRYVEVNYPSPARWDGLAAGRPAAVYFWYRQSPRYLAPQHVEPVDVTPGHVTLEDPPEEISGMAHAILDLRGRLMGLVVVPPQRDDAAGPGPEPDWRALFAAAGLDPETFRSVRPAWTPPVFSDARAAWEGVLPEDASVPIRIEAGAYRGKPVYFQLVGPWSRPARMQAFRETALGSLRNVILWLIGLAALVGGALLARRNLRLGRGDRKGAFRLAACIFSIAMLAWVVGASHVPTFDSELRFFTVSLAHGLLGFCGFWILYIALEPHARRRWPDMLISWSRLLAGRWRDPLVGRDLLIGGLCGTVWIASDPVYHLLPGWLGLPSQAPHPIMPELLLGVRRFLGHIFVDSIFSISLVLMACFFLVLLRIALRRQWAAAAAFFLILTFGYATGAGNPYVNLGYAVLIGAIMSFTLIRFGLLAAMAAMFVCVVTLHLPLTFDFSLWYAGTSLFGLCIVVGVSALGFYLTLAGRPIVREDLLES